MMKREAQKQFQNMHLVLISGYNDFTWMVLLVFESYFIGEICFCEINKASLSLQKLVTSL